MSSVSLPRQVGSQVPPTIAWRNKTNQIQLFLVFCVFSSTSQKTSNDKNREGAIVKAGDMKIYNSAGDGSAYTSLWANPMFFTTNGLVQERERERSLIWRPLLLASGVTSLDRIKVFVGCFFSLFFINIRQSQTATANATATVLLNSDRTSWWAELCTMKTKQEQTWPRFVSWALLEHGARTTPSLRLFYRNTQYMKAQTSGKICSFKLIKTLFSSVLSPVFFLSCELKGF